MGCFDKLVKSHFLANVSTELELARRTIQSMSQYAIPADILACKKARKQIYDNYISQYYVFEELSEMLEEDSQKNMIHYLQLDHIVLICSRVKKQVTEAMLHSHNVNGDLPFYRGKHYIQGYVIHTVLIDTRISVTPSSPN
jgi:hypothetical protein